MAIKEKLKKDLLDANFLVDPDKYILSAATVSFLLTLPAGYVLPMYQLPILFILLFLIALSFPATLANRRASMAEAELPTFLRTLSTELLAGVKFEDALKDSAELSRVIKQLVQHALRLHAEGAPMERALTRATEHIRSYQVQRAFRHLAVVYTSGKGEGTLRKLADELLTIQRAEARNYSAKVAMSSLLFAASAALIPALFETYVLLGSMIMDIGLTPQQVLVLSAVGFPLLSAMVLLTIYLRTPAFLRVG